VLLFHLLDAAAKIIDTAPPFKEFRKVTVAFSREYARGYGMKKMHDL
jgi:hypothetical protein